MLTPSAKAHISQEEILKIVEAYISDQLGLLKTVEQSWQPTDFLPDMTSKDWYPQVLEFRKRAEVLPDDALVVLIGNVVTEEALPSYQSWLNRYDELRDLTGASETPWAKWSRGWTAEENRHGEVLNKYLYLTGRMDMRSFEVTTHYLIKNGFNVKSGTDAYKGLIYASFQERATKISHANTGKIAQKLGEENLSKMCAAIAADEARHEEAYKRFMGKIFEIDASRALNSFYDMMRLKIAMPARLMTDGTDYELFNQFAIIAQRLGVYTTHDYADIIDHLVQTWKIGDLKNLTPEGEKAQNYLCKLSDHYAGLAVRIEEALLKAPKHSFSWIFNRAA